jgi:hypothetical protein
MKPDELVKSQKSTLFVIPAKAKQRESSNFNRFWMPVEDPVLGGDQVRHDGFGLLRIHQTRNWKKGGMDLILIDRILTGCIKYLDLLTPDRWRHEGYRRLCRSPVR